MNRLGAALYRAFCWSRNGLAILGLIFAIVSGGCVVDDVCDALRTRWVVEAPAISPTARALAGKISPRLTELAKAHQDEFVRDAGGPVKRAACRFIYPRVVERIPAACEAGVNDLLDHFGGMRLGELAEAIAAHARFRGAVPDPSIEAAAGVAAPAGKPFRVTCPYCHDEQEVTALPATCESCWKVFNSTGHTPFDGTPRLEP